jgi:hypothetical protein
MIVINKGKNKIFIVTQWHADPDGGPGKIDSQISLMPGEKIELEAIGVELAHEDPIMRVIEHQSEMDSLWPGEFPSIQVALLGAALRHLHAVIEGDALAAKQAKDIYWNLESEL